MKCPVCPAAEVPADARQCPHCGTDLVPILRLHGLGAACYNEALRLAASGAIAEAAERAAAALALDGRSAAGRRLLGKLLWRLGRPAEAVDQWRRTLADAPDDPEAARLLAAAEADRARHRARRRGAYAAAAVVAGFLLTGLLAAVWAAGARVPGLEAQVADLEAYRAAHSFPDADHESLRADLREARAERDDVAGRFDAYQAAHRHGDDAYDAAVAETARLEGERLALVAALDKTTRDLEGARAAAGQERARTDAMKARAAQLEARLGEARSRGDEAAAALAQARLERDRAHEWIRGSIVPLFESMRPARADRLAADIQEARSALAALKDLEARYRQRGIPIVDALKTAETRDHIRRAVMNLQLRETEYRDIMTPWVQATERLQAALDTWSEAAPAPKAGPERRDP